MNELFNEKTIHSSLHETLKKTIFEIAKQVKAHQVVEEMTRVDATRKDELHKKNPYLLMGDLMQLLQPIEEASITTRNSVH